MYFYVVLGLGNRVSLKRDPIRLNKSRGLRFSERTATAREAKRARPRSRARPEVDLLTDSKRLAFVTFLIGFNNLIPISLYVTTDVARAFRSVRNGGVELDAHRSHIHIYIYIYYIIYTKYVYITYIYILHYTTCNRLAGLLGGASETDEKRLAHPPWAILVNHNYNYHYNSYYYNSYHYYNSFYHYTIPVLVEAETVLR